MTEAGQRSGQASTGDASRPEGPSNVGYERSGWTVWVLFAGIMMIMIGSFHVISGLVGLVRDEYYLVASSGLVVTMDYTAWGWTHLLLGILVFAAGCGAIVGQTWARVVGVALAVLSAIANMLFIAAYPVWSTLIITLDVIVIYSLIVHGRELKVTS